jgi:hypothetical protein
MAVFLGPFTKPFCLYVGQKSGPISHFYFVGIYFYLYEASKMFENILKTVHILLCLGFIAFLVHLYHMIII